MTKNQHTAIFYLLLANSITSLMNFTLADQAGARKTCQETAFSCGDGNCIPLMWRCDGEDDCGDKSDEFGCHKTKCNPDTEFACSDNGCIRAVFKCDGHKDCPGGEDEELSTCSNTSELEMEAHGYLLVARKYDIRKISLDHQKTITVINDTKLILAFDFDFQTGSIFWSESLSHKIYKSSIENESEKSIIVSNELMASEGLAVDWLYKHLYWTDDKYKTISVANLDGNFQKVLIEDDIDRPRAIAVNPIQGWMFWTDWGEKPKIERTGMDGTHRQTIVSSNLEWPNSLTIDFIKGRLYWVDAKLHTISTCDYDGARRELILFSDRYLQHPFSITTLNDSIYWINLGGQAVYKADKFTGNDVKSVSSESSSDGHYLMGIHIYDSLRQPVGINHCTENNINCSQLCLPAPYLDSKSPQISCACSEDFRLSLDGISCIKDGARKTCQETAFTCGDGNCIPLTWRCDGDDDCGDKSDEFGCHKTKCNPDTEFACSDNGCINSVLKCDGHKDCPGGEDEELTTCSNTSEPETEAHSYLLVARRYDIRKISLDHQETITIKNNTKSTVAFDFDFQTGSIFWSESLTHKIYKSSIENGSEKSIIISNEQMLTEGLAVDWLYKHLFWTEIRYKTISVANLDGSFQKVLIKDDIDRPRAIAVNPIQGWMFWADWGVKPKIERAGMDGTHRQTIVSSNLGWPNSLTIDFIKGRLYWVDAKLHTISTCDYDGARRELILFSDQYLQIPFSITTFNYSIYWINLGDQSVYKADKFTENDVKIANSESSSDGDFPVGIHIYDSLRQPVGINHCTKNNRKCSQLCFPAPHLDSKSPQISCACAEGFRLSLDGFGCIEDDSTFYPCNKKTHFGCGNGVCIPNSKLCDKTPDCIDYLDELVENCNINECEVNNGGCPYLCVDTPRSFYCDCEPGYKLINNKTCEIIQ